MTALDADDGVEHGHCMEESAETAGVASSAR